MVSKNIIISNPKKLEEVKNKIKNGGKDKLHIIADFDKTLTMGADKGDRKVTSIINLIALGGYLTPDYPKKAHALFDKYYPIEISAAIPLEERKKKMQEWWRKHFELLIKSGINLGVIEEIIKNKKLLFRKGTFEFLDRLNKNNISLVIMSAGPGDMIKEYLRANKKLYKNIHIIANFFEFDKNRKAISVNKPIIHTFNKSETSVKNLPIYNKLLKRKNVILLGDILGDVGMIEGFPYENLIKIGFLNQDVDERLEEFKKNYDVVIINDGSMDYVNEVVGDVISD